MNFVDGNSNKFAKIGFTLEPMAQATLVSMKIQ
jgi:hypothetical protein